jgi:hypothetical protein
MEPESDQLAHLRRIETEAALEGARRLVRRRSRQCGNERRFPGIERLAA